MMGDSSDLQTIPNDSVKYRIGKMRQANAPDPLIMHQSPRLGAIQNQAQGAFKRSDEIRAKPRLAIFIKADSL